MTAHDPGRRDHTLLSRRDAVRLMGGAGAATIFGAHTLRNAAAQEPQVEIAIPDSGAELPTDDVTFRLMDSGDAKAFFWKAYFPAYEEAHPNITVQYDGLPWNEIGQIIPLGVQNGNPPDVFQLPLNIPLAQAVREGWLAPWDDLIPDFATYKAAFPTGAFVPGITDFDGKSYGISPTSNVRYGTMLLYNKDYLDQAGLDPSATPFTWDQFRAAAKTLTEQGQGQYYGLIFEGNQTGRYSQFVNNLARMAGASNRDVANGPIDWRTGQFIFTHDQILAAVDLLLAIEDDGSIFPGSLSLNAPQARAQMPQGVAAMILQGPWNISQWQRENPDFNFGVASQPVPNTGEPVALTVGPGGGNTYVVFKGSPYQAIAGDVFAYLGSLDGQRVWAQLVGVADPVMLPAAADAYRENPRQSRAFDIFAEQVRVGPDPRVRNPDEADVFLELQNLTPNFGETIQGLFTGQLDDPKAAMQDLQDRAEAELERAIKAAQDKGAQVSRDDWVFPNWDPTRDYTADDYAALGG